MYGEKNHTDDERVAIKVINKQSRMFQHEEIQTPFDTAPSGPPALRRGGCSPAGQLC